VKTKAELEHFILTKHLATAESLTNRELTAGEIQLMPEPVYSWHQQNNLKNVEAALDAPRIQAGNKKNAVDAKSSRIWADKATEEEIQESISEVAKFCQRYPQFVGSYVPNREALISFLRERNLPCVKANLVTAFEDLASKGLLVLNPSAIGIGMESEISGYRVVRHPELYKLLAPAPTEGQRAKLEQGKMSADEYRKQHPEAFRDPQVYADTAEKIKREINSFRSFHPEYKLTEENSKHLQAYISKRKLPFNRESLEAAYSELVREGYIETNPEAVVSSGGTKLIDYGGRPGRANLSHEINRMSAAEYTRWLENPANRRLVDDLAVV